MIEFILNEKNIRTDLPPGMVLLDFIRYQQNLKGTKIGCREGDCGACTVLVGEIINGKLEYRSHTSCLMPIGNAQAKHIVSVEGINFKHLNPVQQAIVDEGGTQCGFCTVGFVMSLVGFCMSSAEPNQQQAIAAIDGNICRCTGYKSLERAAATIVEKLQQKNKQESISWLVENKFIPAYFLEISDRLKAIQVDSTAPENKVLVGGGTDLYVQKHDAMTHSSIHFVTREASNRSIQEKEGRIIIGAAATVEDLRQNSIMKSYFPNLAKHLKLVSSTPIRNMATLAGNFVNASPIGDMTIFFMALDAKLRLSNGKSEREIELKNFYKGYKTLDKSADEWIVSLSFPLPSADAIFNFEKVCKRTHLDIASANAAMQIQLKSNTIERIHLSCGGVFAYPLYLHKTVAFMTGKVLDEGLLHQAAKILLEEISPISDSRGDAAYKSLLARQLFYAHFLQHFSNLIKPERLVSSPTI